MEEVKKTITLEDGVRLTYRITRAEKQRPLLVMIHGLASNMTRWSEFLAHTRLSDQWDLLRLDLRGHGYSMVRGSIGIQQWCKDLAALLDIEGYKKAVILGHSLGAQVGMHFHDAHPDRVSALIMVDPVFPNNLNGNLLKARRLRPLVWLCIRLLWFVNAIGFRQRTFPHRDLRKLDERTREMLTAQPDEAIGSIYTRPRIDIRFIPLANYLQDMIAVVGPLPPPSSIDVPVLVILSVGATISNPEKNLTTIHRMPQSQIVSIKANHWPLTEKPKETREAIEQWCQQFFEKTLTRP